VTLPLKQHLKEGTWTGMVPFHPLSENSLRGESEIIKFLTKTIRFRIAFVGAQLAQTLMDIAADPEHQKALTTKQADYLKSVPGANEKTAKVMAKLLTEQFDNLVSIYLKRDGKYAGHDYPRVAVVTFPIWEEMTSKGTKICGVETGSNKSKQSIAAIFDYVFQASQPEVWNSGSSDNAARYLHALLSSYVKIASHLNGLLYHYRKHVEHVDLLRCDLTWDEQLKSLSDLKHAIPPLFGNDGAPAKGEKAAPAHPVHTDRSGLAKQLAAGAKQYGDPQPEQQPVHAPYAPPAPAPVNADPSDWRRLLPKPQAPVPAPHQGYPQPHAPYPPQATAPQLSPFTAQQYAQPQVVASSPMSMQASLAALQAKGRGPSLTNQVVTHQSQLHPQQPYQAPMSVGYGSGI
jgi:hypothetical protein